MSSYRLILSFVFGVFMMAGCGSGDQHTEQKVPFSGRYVKDMAGLMRKADALDLEQNLADYDQTYGLKFGIASIPELGEAQTVDAATVEMAVEMGVGDPGVNNGCMVLISQKERKVKIDIGYGLEWQIPDSLSSLILNYQMLPQFKDNNYFLGLRDGLEEISNYARIVSWDIEYGSFGDLVDNPKDAEGKIVKFHGKALSNVITNALMEDQFSPKYAVNVETIYGDTVKLYFSKYMLDMVDRIAAWDDGIIYARIRSTAPWEMELLGIDN